jgi:hypothetical protein
MVSSNLIANKCRHEDDSRFRNVYLVFTLHLEDFYKTKVKDKTTFLKHIKCSFWVGGMQNQFEIKQIIKSMTITA